MTTAGGRGTPAHAHERNYVPMLNCDAVNPPLGPLLLRMTS